MYSTCVDNCGWGSAGIPPLVSITSSCSDANGITGQSALPTASPTTPQGGGNTASQETMTAGVTGLPLTTTSSGGNTNSKGSGSSATSGVNNRDDVHRLLLRFQGVVLAGVVVLWIFGWL